MIYEILKFKKKLFMNKSSSSGKVIFSDESVYVGELENEIPNGYGVWTHPNGEEYKIQWSDGKENGAGVYSSRRWRILGKLC